MSFTRYIAGSGGLTGNRISIAKNGISFGREFRDNNPDLENKNRVVLYYDKEAKQVGIQFVSDDDPIEVREGSLRMTKSEFTNTWYVSATRFKKLSGAKQGKYDYRIEDGIYILDNALGEEGAE